MDSSTTSILIATLPVVGTIVGSYMGVRTSTKLLIYRLTQVEKKVDKYNTIVERLPIIEEMIKRIPDIEKNIEALQKELNALKICMESSKDVKEKVEKLQTEINSLKMLFAQLNIDIPKKKELN